MRLQDFIKEIYSQPAVKGQELAQVEIDVCINKVGRPDRIEGEGYVLYVGGNSPCAKISIVPREKDDKCYVVIDTAAEGHIIGVFKSETAAKKCKPAQFDPSYIMIEEHEIKEK